MHLADLLDRLVGLGFLAEELVTRESEHHEVLMRVGIPELLEFFKLWCETTLGGSIDYEEDFSPVFAHGDSLSIRFLHCDVVDWAHKSVLKNPFQYMEGMGKGK